MTSNNLTCKETLPKEDEKLHPREMAGRSGLAQPRPSMPTGGYRVGYPVMPGLGQQPAQTPAPAALPPQPPPLPQPPQILPMPQSSAARLQQIQKPTTSRGSPYIPSSGSSRIIQQAHIAQGAAAASTQPATIGVGGLGFAHPDRTGFQIYGRTTPQLQPHPQGAPQNLQPAAPKAVYKNPQADFGSVFAPHTTLAALAPTAIALQRARDEVMRQQVVNQAAHVMSMNAMSNALNPTLLQERMLAQVNSQAAVAAAVPQSFRNNLNLPKPTPIHTHMGQQSGRSTVDPLRNALGLFQGTATPKPMDPTPLARPSSAFPDSAVKQIVRGGGTITAPFAARANLFQERTSRASGSTPSTSTEGSSSTAHIAHVPPFNRLSQRSTSSSSHESAIVGPRSAIQPNFPSAQPARPVPQMIRPGSALPQQQPINPVVAPSPMGPISSSSPFGRLTNPYLSSTISPTPPSTSVGLATPSPRPSILRKRPADQTSENGGICKPPPPPPEPPMLGPSAPWDLSKKVSWALNNSIHPYLANEPAKRRLGFDNPPGTASTTPNPPSAPPAGVSAPPNDAPSFSAADLSGPSTSSTVLVGETLHKMKNVNEIKTEIDSQLDETPKKRMRKQQFDVNQAPDQIRMEIQMPTNPGMAALLANSTATVHPEVKKKRGRPSALMKAEKEALATTTTSIIVDLDKPFSPDQKDKQKKAMRRKTDNMPILQKLSPAPYCVPSTSQQRQGVVRTAKSPGRPSLGKTPTPKHLHRPDTSSSTATIPMTATPTEKGGTQLVTKGQQKQMGIEERKARKGDEKKDSPKKGARDLTSELFKAASASFGPLAGSAENSEQKKRAEKTRKSKTKESSEADTSNDSIQSEHERASWRERCEGLIKFTELHQVLDEMDERRGISSRSKTKTSEEANPSKAETFVPLYEKMRVANEIKSNILDLKGIPVKRKVLRVRRLVMRRKKDTSQLLSPKSEHHRTTRLRRNLKPYLPNGLPIFHKNKLVLSSSMVDSANVHRKKNRKSVRNMVRKHGRRAKEVLLQHKRQLKRRNRLLAEAAPAVELYHDIERVDDTPLDATAKTIHFLFRNLECVRKSAKLEKKMVELEAKCVADAGKERPTSGRCNSPILFFNRNPNTRSILNDYSINYNPRIFFVTQNETAKQKRREYKTWKKYELVLNERRRKSDACVEELIRNRCNFYNSHLQKGEKPYSVPEEIKENLKEASFKEYHRNLRQQLLAIYDKFYDRNGHRIYDQDRRVRTMERIQHEDRIRWQSMDKEQRAEWCEKRRREQFVMQHLLETPSNTSKKPVIVKQEPLDGSKKKSTESKKEAPNKTQYNVIDEEDDIQFLFQSSEPAPVLKNDEFALRPSQSVLARHMMKCLLERYRSKIPGAVYRMKLFLPKAHSKALPERNIDKPVDPENIVDESTSLDRIKSEEPAVSEKDKQEEPCADANDEQQPSTSNAVSQGNPLTIQVDTSDSKRAPCVFSPPPALFYVYSKCRRSRWKKRRVVRPVKRTFVVSETTIREVQRAVRQKNVRKELDGKDSREVTAAVGTTRLGDEIPTLAQNRTSNTKELAATATHELIEPKEEESDQMNELKEEDDDEYVEYDGEVKSHDEGSSEGEYSDEKQEGAHANVVSARVGELGTTVEVSRRKPGRPKKIRRPPRLDPEGNPIVRQEKPKKKVGRPAKKKRGGKSVSDPKEEDEKKEEQEKQDKDTDDAKNKEPPKRRGRKPKKESVVLVDIVPDVVDPKMITTRSMSQSTPPLAPVVITSDDSVTPRKRSGRKQKMDLLETPPEQKKIGRPRKNVDNDLSEVFSFPMHGEDTLPPKRRGRKPKKLMDDDDMIKEEVEDPETPSIRLYTTASGEFPPASTSASTRTSAEEDIIENGPYKEQMIVEEYTESTPTSPIRFIEVTPEPVEFDPNAISEFPPDESLEDEAIPSTSADDMPSELATPLYSESGADTTFESESNIDPPMSNTLFSACAANGGLAIPRETASTNENDVLGDIFVQKKWDSSKLYRETNSSESLDGIRTFLKKNATTSHRRSYSRLAEGSVPAIQWQTKKVPMGLQLVASKKTKKHSNEGKISEAKEEAKLPSAKKHEHVHKISTPNNITPLMALFLKNTADVNVFSKYQGMSLEELKKINLQDQQHNELRRFIKMARKVVPAPVTEHFDNASVVTRLLVHNAQSEYSSYGSLRPPLENFTGRLLPYLTTKDAQPKKVLEPTCATEPKDNQMNVDEASSSTHIQDENIPSSETAQSDSLGLIAEPPRSSQELIRKLAEMLIDHEDHKKEQRQKAAAEAARKAKARAEAERAAALREKKRIETLKKRRETILAKKAARASRLLNIKQEPCDPSFDLSKVKQEVPDASDRVLTRRQRENGQVQLGVSTTRNELVTKASLKAPPPKKVKIEPIDPDDTEIQVTTVRKTRRNSDEPVIVKTIKKEILDSDDDEPIVIETRRRRPTELSSKPLKSIKQEPIDPDDVEVLPAVSPEKLKKKLVNGTEDTLSQLPRIETEMAKDAHEDKENEKASEKETPSPPRRTTKIMRKTKKKMPASPRIVAISPAKSEPSFVCLNLDRLKKHLGMSEQPKREKRLRGAAKARAEALILSFQKMRQLKHRLRHQWKPDKAVGLRDLLYKKLQVQMTRRKKAIRLRLKGRSPRVRFAKESPRSAGRRVAKQRFWQRVLRYDSTPLFARESTDIEEDEEECPQSDHCYGKRTSSCSQSATTVEDLTPKRPITLAERKQAYQVQLEMERKRKEEQERIEQEEKERKKQERITAMEEWMSEAVAFGGTAAYRQTAMKRLSKFAEKVNIPQWFFPQLISMREEELRCDRIVNYLGLSCAPSVHADDYVSIEHLVRKFHPEICTASDSNMMEPDSLIIEDLVDSMAAFVATNVDENTILSRVCFTSDRTALNAVDVPKITADTLLSDFQPSLVQQKQSNRFLDILHQYYPAERRKHLLSYRYKQRIRVSKVVAMRKIHRCVRRQLRQKRIRTLKRIRKIAFGAKNSTSNQPTICDISKQEDPLSDKPTETAVLKNHVHKKNATIEHPSNLRAHNYAHRELLNVLRITMKNITGIEVEDAAFEKSHELVNKCVEKLVVHDSDEKTKISARIKFLNIVKGILGRSFEGKEDERYKKVAKGFVKLITRRNLAHAGDNVVLGSQATVTGETCKNNILKTKENTRELSTFDAKRNVVSQSSDNRVGAAQPPVPKVIQAYRNLIKSIEQKSKLRVMRKRTDKNNETIQRTQKILRELLSHDGVAQSIHAEKFGDIERKPRYLAIRNTKSGRTITKEAVRKGSSVLFVKEVIKKKYETLNRLRKKRTSHDQAVAESRVLRAIALQGNGMLATSEEKERTKPRKKKSLKRLQNANVAEVELLASEHNTEEKESNKDDASSLVLPISKPAEQPLPNFIHDADDDSTIEQETSTPSNIRLAEGGHRFSSDTDSEVDVVKIDDNESPAPALSNTDSSPSQLLLMPPPPPPPMLLNDFAHPRPPTTVEEDEGEIKKEEEEEEENVEKVEEFHQAGKETLQLSTKELITDRVTNALRVVAKKRTNRVARTMLAVVRKEDLAREHARVISSAANTGLLLRHQTRVLHTRSVGVEEGSAFRLMNVSNKQMAAAYGIRDVAVARNVVRVLRNLGRSVRKSRVRMSPAALYLRMRNQILKKRIFRRTQKAKEDYERDILERNEKREAARIAQKLTLKRKSKQFDSSSEEFADVKPLLSPRTPHERAEQYLHKQEQQAVSKRMFTTRIVEDFLTNLKNKCQVQPSKKPDSTASEEAVSVNKKKRTISKNASEKSLGDEQSEDSARKPVVIVPSAKLIPKLSDVIAKEKQLLAPLAPTPMVTPNQKENLAVVAGIDPSAHAVPARSASPSELAPESLKKQLLAKANIKLTKKAPGTRSFWKFPSLPQAKPVLRIAGGRILLSKPRLLSFPPLCLPSKNVRSGLVGHLKTSSSGHPRLPLKPIIPLPHLLLLSSRLPPRLNLIHRDRGFGVKRRRTFARSGQRTAMRNRSFHLTRNLRRTAVNTLRRKRDGFLQCEHLRREVTSLPNAPQKRKAYVPVKIAEQKIVAKKITAKDSPTHLNIPIDSEVTRSIIRNLLQKRTLQASQCGEEDERRAMITRALGLPSKAAIVEPLSMRPLPKSIVMKGALNIARKKKLRAKSKAKNIKSKYPDGNVKKANVAVASSSKIVETAKSGSASVISEAKTDYAEPPAKKQRLLRMQTIASLDRRQQRNRTVSHRFARRRRWSRRREEAEKMIEHRIRVAERMLDGSNVVRCIAMRKAQRKRKIVRVVRRKLSKKRLSDIPNSPSKMLLYLARLTKTPEQRRASRYHRLLDEMREEENIRDYRHSRIRKIFGENGLATLKEKLMDRLQKLKIDISMTSSAEERLLNSYMQLLKTFDSEQYIEVIRQINFDFDDEDSDAVKKRKRLTRLRTAVMAVPSKRIHVPKLPYGDNADTIKILPNAEQLNQIMGALSPHFRGPLKKEQDGSYINRKGRIVTPKPAAYVPPLQEPRIQYAEEAKKMYDPLNKAVRRKKVSAINLQLERVNHMQHVFDEMVRQQTVKREERVVPPGEASEEATAVVKRELVPEDNNVVKVSTLELRRAVNSEFDRKVKQRMQRVKEMLATVIQPLHLTILFLKNTRAALITKITGKSPPIKKKKPIVISATPRQTMKRRNEERQSRKDSLKKPKLSPTMKKNKPPVKRKRSNSFRDRDRAVKFHIPKREVPDDYDEELQIRLAIEESLKDVPSTSSGIY